MRPRLYTARNFALLFAALLILGGMAYWLKSGMPLPGVGVASTAGKIAFLSDRGGHTDLYMMDADGSKVAVLAPNVGGDDRPAWSADGATLAFVSGVDAAKGGNPQIAEMNAASGASIATLTQTSSSKSSPRFGAENRVFYLAAGQLVATTSDGTDSDKIFPTFDEQKLLQGNDAQPGVLSMGGISRVALAPDGDHVALTLKTEHGEALLLYEIHSQTCDLIGLGERIFFDFVPDGRLVAVFRAGVPLPKPQTIFNAEVVKSPLSVVPKEAINGAFPGEQTVLAFFDATGNMQSPQQIPFAPDSFAVSSDGQTAAFGIATTSDAKDAFPVGAYLLPLGSGSRENPFKGPVQDLSFSPDGKTVTIASAGDIYAAPTDGSAPAKNLTNGQGKNSAPVWSPAKSK